MRRELTLTRLIDAPRELVFKAWTQADHLARWWGPKDFTNPVCDVDARVGGSLYIVMRSPLGDEYPMRGIFQEVIASERLAFTNIALDKNGKPLLEGLTKVHFVDEDGKTRLTVETSAEGEDALVASMLEGMEAGWSGSLDKLVAYATRKDSPRCAVHASLTVMRTLAHPPAKVFAAWSSKEAKARWFKGPEGSKDDIREMDFREGGAERVRVLWPDGKISDFSAHYHDIVPSDRIVYSYKMHINDIAISVSLATIEFKPEGPGTRLIITEHGAFLDGHDGAAMREHGTKMLMERLDAALQAVK